MFLGYLDHGFYSLTLYSGFKFSQLEMSAYCHPDQLVSHLINFKTEVVLSVLVEYLKFELPKEEIYWNTAGIQFPTVGRVNDHSQLPLKVSLAKNA